jgi:Ca2+-binding EF-hand superfamily protein
MNAYNEMFDVFAKLHPIEAYDLNSEKFCKFMKRKGFKLSNTEIEKLINESR